jgi:hypothetical protein
MAHQTVAVVHTNTNHHNLARQFQGQIWKSNSITRGPPSFSLLHLALTFHRYGCSVGPGGSDASVLFEMWSPMNVAIVAARASAVRVMVGFE